MLHSTFQSIQHSRQSRLWNRLERSLTAALLTFGLGVAASQVSYGSELIAPVDTAPTETIAASESEPTFENGIYLYGQSSEPDQVGSEYLVFEVRDRQIIGAFYMPYSSFDCFYGTVEADQLALTIDPAYEEVEYSYAIALDESAAVASTDPSSVLPVGLEGYTRLEQLSENDQRILGVCQTNHGEI